MPRRLEFREGCSPGREMVISHGSRIMAETHQTSHSWDRLRTSKKCQNIPADRQLSSCVLCPTFIRTAQTTEWCAFAEVIL